MELAELLHRELTGDLNRLFFDPAKHTPRPAPTPKLPTDAADLLYPELAYTIVGGLYEVHNTLGPGFIYHIYNSACHHEMQLRQLAPERRKSMSVIYKETPIGNVAFDHLIIADQVTLSPAGTSTKCPAIHSRPGCELVGFAWASWPISTPFAWMSFLSVREGVLRRMAEWADRFFSHGRSRSCRQL